MKTFFKKRLLLLFLICLLLLCCVQFKNIKFIVDDQALFGFEIDLTEMEIVLYSSTHQAKRPLEEDNPQQRHPSIRPDQLLESHP